jgi:hypothetical protein
LGGFPFNPRGVTPEIFETVEIAFFAMKDVNYNLEIIQHDPLAGRKAIDGSGANPFVLA